MDSKLRVTPYGIITAYNKYNCKSISEKEYTLLCIEKYLKSDDELKKIIAFEICKIRDIVYTNILQINIKNWCLMKQKGICYECSEWNHLHRKTCMNHPINMRNCANKFISCNNELYILPCDIDKIVYSFLYIKN